MAKLLLGGVLATVLLGLYMASIVVGIQTTNKCGKAAETVATKIADGEKPEEANKQLCSDAEKNLGNISYLLNLLGGLISATVIGVLAATKANDLPAKNFFKSGLGKFAQGIAAYVPLGYILVWIFCGLFVVIYGLMLYDNDPSPPLTAHAKTWLGTAVAAIYAYIGISPDGSPVERLAIANIVIDSTIELSSATQTSTLTVTAKDVQNTPITNLPNDRFHWTSDDETVAKVDQMGLVTWVREGKCNITATANAGAVVSNNCAVECGT